MGLLRSTDCLDWADILKIKEDLKRDGVEQFVQVYKNSHSNFMHDFIWGDELELMMCGWESGEQTSYQLLLGSEDIISNFKNEKLILAVEFASYMIETTPSTPHLSEFNDLLKIEDCMVYRISVIANEMKRRKQCSAPLLMTCFPKLGKYPSFYKNTRGKDLKYETTQSDYFPDNAITGHKRFFSFVQNIIKRRGKKVEGYIKIMDNEHDRTSRNPANEVSKTDLIDKTRLLESHIKVDSMGQGMGCCCLQMTLQASTMHEARRFYDMLGSLCPLFLRLTRATPISQGRLLATETRWDMLVFSVDCRTDEERGCEFNISGNEKATNNGRIHKSRFSSIDMYISEDPSNLPEYNDLDPALHEDSYKYLKGQNVDEKMARHVSSLFIRDPILVYKKIEISKEENIEDSVVDESTKSFFTDDFENIQSSNWRSMRFKLPSQNCQLSESGWKVEVRPMEIQPTAFENASWCIFVVLLSKAIKEYNLNFYIPISLVDENFRRANLLFNKECDYKSKVPKDKAKFYYRINIYEQGKACITEGTLDEIFLGNNREYKGIFNIVEKYVEENMQETCDRSLFDYLNFVKKRLTGELLSVSDFMRKYVITHKDYKNDAVASEEILNELIEKILSVTEVNTTDYLINE